MLDFFHRKIVDLKRMLQEKPKIKILLFFHKKNVFCPAIFN